jgi:hypothetical protein
VNAAELLDVLWRDHIVLAPQVARIHDLLTERGELLVHDHLGFLTFGASGLDGDALARPFAARGWQPGEHHRFCDERIDARCWQHADPALPRLLFCELALTELSPAAGAVIERLVGQLPAGFADRDDAAWAGRPWQLSHADYQTLDAESAHAAWIAAFGFRVHHFTVDVDSLQTFPDLEALAAFLAEHGFRIDDLGGIIKGSRAERLEQLATRHELAQVAFVDATVRVPACRYELARRYPLPSGDRFRGFLPSLSGRPRALSAAPL